MHITAARLHDRDSYNIFILDYLASFSIYFQIRKMRGKLCVLFLSSSNE